MSLIDCPADIFIFQWLPLFERVSHCELILKNRQCEIADEQALLAVLEATREQIEKLSGIQVEKPEDLEEPEEPEETDLSISEIDPNTIATELLTPEPFSPRTRSRPTQPNKRWLDRVRPFLKEHGPATADVICEALGVTSERDKMLLRDSLHASYSKCREGHLRQVGSVYNPNGRAHIIWMI